MLFQVLFIFDLFWTLLTWISGGKSTSAKLSEHIFAILRSVLGERSFAAWGDTFKRSDVTFMIPKHLKNNFPNPRQANNPPQGVGEVGEIPKYV